MKKRLLVAMLAFTLTMTGCGSNEANDVAENTEVSLSAENEVRTEIMAGAAIVAPIVETTEETTELEREAIETTEAAKETEMEEEETAFTVAAMSATKYAKSSVNVRKGPSVDYEKIGSLSTNQKVKIIGQADTGWYQIELDGEIAYVSNNYLVDEKITVNTTSSENTGVTENTGSNDVAEETEWVDDWGEPDFVGGGIGTGEPVTDGEGPGVEIEITPMP